MYATPVDGPAPEELWEAVARAQVPTVRWYFWWD
jgi:hypothetical protein